MTGVVVLLRKDSLGLLDYSGYDEVALVLVEDVVKSYFQAEVFQAEVTVLLAGVLEDQLSCYVIA
jgi:hypothetical protein